MAQDGVRPTTLRVDGAMAANNWLMTFLADMLDATIERPLNIETTALGAAYLAGLQTGVFESLESLAALWQSQRRFEPNMTQSQRDQLYQQWKNAVARVKS